MAHELLSPLFAAHRSPRDSGGCTCRIMRRFNADDCIMCATLCDALPTTDVLCMQMEKSKSCRVSTPSAAVKPLQHCMHVKVLLHEQQDVSCVQACQRRTMLVFDEEACILSPVCTISQPLLNVAFFKLVNMRLPLLALLHGVDLQRFKCACHARGICSAGACVATPAEYWSEAKLLYAAVAHVFVQRLP